ncbi:MAG TPA: cytidine deaminase [candidate division WOR-3 bacterium]|uniref:Cytidine deaminase n=1 Tax=candidate division WOR-3 bacterium TaxID=2052148 RepID=A0A7V0XEK8_UNCW3|nr:cytidine deaminase [candidate division WOR-3 bacterium]
MTRKSWDRYFMDIARLVSERSTCRRRRVGAVLVREKRILCTGYNGAPAGMPHCDEVGCLRERLSIPSGERIEICRGIHAEQNALVQAAAFGIKVTGATLYCTHEPCITCGKMLLNAGIREFVVAESYADEFGRQLLAEAGAEVRLVDHPAGHEPGPGA